jgi:hypothetical protein
MALTWLRNALGSNPQDPPFLVLYPGKSHCVQCAWLGKISLEHSSGITLRGVPNAALHLSSIASRLILSSPLRVPHERREYFCKPDCRAFWRAPAETDEDARSTLHSDTSRPFDKPQSGRIAVKVINHLGDEVTKVFQVA